MSSETTSTVPKTSFLGLPSELREQIYRHYFKAAGGYVYDAATETLRQTDGTPVDIALRYACRSIAYETRDYPFQLNSIKFSTVHRDDWQETAAIHTYVVLYHHYLQMGLLTHLRDLVTPDMYECSNHSHREYMPAIKREIDRVIAYILEMPRTNVFSGCEMYRTDGDPPGDDYWAGSLPTMNRKFKDKTIVFNDTVAYLLRILAKRHPDQFAQAVDVMLPGWPDSHPASEVLDLKFEPWAIPSHSEAISMAKTLRLEGPVDCYTEWRVNADAGLDDPMFTGTRYQYRQMGFFSATAVAIRFLKRIPEYQRLNMRKLILDEDRPAVGLAMCHGIGLIPFCKENTKLHIEHCWNLWTTLLLRTEQRWISSLTMNFELSPEKYQEWIDDDSDFGPWTLHEASKQRFSNIFHAWCMNILDVVNSGMPLQSYTVMIEGDPDLNLSTLAFHDVMARNIAWLTLNTDCVARGLFAPPDHHDYPLMTRPSIEGSDSSDTRSSLIQCNFTLDQPWDLEKIVEEYSVQRQPYRPYRPWDNILDPGSDDFRVLTDTLDYKKLQLLWVDRKPRSEDDLAAKQGRQ
ncbi:hypothetical protein FPSE_07989 [Fusarium pseudograminearum CS3096]|uniref:Uncharacterized protein n=1 Tax=Fusarium pseudograminearum (strain CS3096) TaxID=1028729 RepID=K3VDM6_FUSPC|nr:hypothetical protein FPSE_07989 [Fusarium pseudograminearum CS3096]EKJ71804.1 hypothetical protein FPSE_07989 [Fusarium pseudograminearum CS3096]